MCARSIRLVCATIAVCLHGPLSFSIGQDFAALTALAEGALVGANVDEAVPGFEIRLLKSGQVLYHQAFGEWSLDRPARADSSTKTLSGALMMSLAETAESGFALDSELSEFLAEYDQAGLRDITVRQAFSHTAGFEGQDATSLILAAPNITLRRAAELISTKTLINGPAGSTFAYGGLSMHAAGAAAEVATGQSYVAFFAERISTPLGLTDTQFVTASDSNPRVAGGAQSTATDFAKFMDMLLNGGIDRATGTRILQETSVEEMLTRQTTDAQPIANSPLDNSRYGIGVWLDQLTQVGPGVDALAGGARGFHSWIDASHDLVFAFATDLTTIANVEVLSSTMHQVILEAIAEPGDFNLDGQVDGADYLNWQMDERSAVDLLSWQANYGSSVTTFLVPEPSTGLLILGGIMAFVTLCQYLVRRD